MAYEMNFVNGVLVSASLSSASPTANYFQFTNGLLTGASMVTTGSKTVYTMNFINGLLCNNIVGSTGSSGSSSGSSGSVVPPSGSLEFIGYEGYYNPVTPTPIYDGHYTDGLMEMNDYTDPGVHRIGNYVFEKFIFKLTFSTSYSVGRIVYDLEFFDYTPGDVRYYSTAEFAGMQTYLYPDKYDTLYTHFGDTLYGTTAGLSVSLISINKTRKLINSTSSDWATGPGTRWMSIAFESLYRTVPVSFQLHAVYWLSGGIYTQLWP